MGGSGVPKLGSKQCCGSSVLEVGFEMILKQIKKINWTSQKLSIFLLAACLYAWIVPFFFLGFLQVLKVAFSEPYIQVPPYKNMISVLSKEGVSFNIYLANFFDLFDEKIYVYALLRSVKIAALSTFVTLLIAYPMALSLALMPKKHQTSLLLLILLPFWTSFLLRVYAWIGLLSSDGTINTFLSYVGLIDEPLTLLHTDFSVVLGMVYCYLPFMLLPLYSVLHKFDWSLLEAAADLGCRPRTAFRLILLPNTLSGIFYGCFFVFIPALGEVIIPILLGGSKSVLFGRVIWEEFFFNRDWTMASMLSLALLVILSIPIYLAQRKARD